MTKRADSSGLSWTVARRLSEETLHHMGDAVAVERACCGNLKNQEVQRALEHVGLVALTYA